MEHWRRLKHNDYIAYTTARKGLCPNSTDENYRGKQKHKLRNQLKNLNKPLNQQDYAAQLDPTPFWKHKRERLVKGVLHKSVYLVWLVLSTALLCALAFPFFAQ